MDYTAAIDRIMHMVDYERPATVPRGRARYDLVRISALLEALGNPHLGIPTAHIAGTKGKGSTAAMVSSVLSAAGYEPGLFTSPHLHTFRERIQVGGKLIPEEDFASLVEELWPTVESVSRSVHGRVTVFEFLTAMAFYYFRDRGVRANVIEVGLGGRLDATNVVQPLACGITSLGLDHTEVLGDTLDKIAWEKAGIMKPGVPVVSAPQKPEAMKVLQEVSRQHGAALTVAGEDIHWQLESSSVAGQTLTLETARNHYRLHIPLLGKHQLENSAVAIGIIEALIEGGLDISRDSIEQGYLSVQWPCRLEVLAQDPTLVADGAHNPHSAGRLVEAIRELFQDKRIIMVVGVSGNKDIEGLIGELRGLSPAMAIATRSRHPRAAKPERIAKEFSPYSERVLTTERVSDALDMARNMTSKGDLILVTGSLFVAAEAREHIKGITPEIYPTFEPYMATVPPGI